MKELGELRRQVELPHACDVLIGVLFAPWSEKVAMTESQVAIANSEIRL